VFAEKPEVFNRLVQRVCTLVDHQLDVPPSRSSSSSIRGRLRRVRSDVGQIFRTMSSAEYRRCDSQIITEEDNSLYTELGSHVAATDDVPRPVFVVDEKDLN